MRRHRSARSWETRPLFTCDEGARFSQDEKRSRWLRALIDFFKVPASFENGIRLEPQAQRSAAGVSLEKFSGLFGTFFLKGHRTPAGDKTTEDLDRHHDVAWRLVVCVAPNHAMFDLSTMGRTGCKAVMSSDARKRCAAVFCVSDWVFLVGVERATRLADGENGRRGGKKNKKCRGDFLEASIRHGDSGQLL